MAKGEDADFGSAILNPKSKMGSRTFGGFLALSLVLHAGLLGLAAVYPWTDATPPPRPEPIYVDVVDPDLIPGLRDVLSAARPGPVKPRRPLARIFPAPRLPVGGAQTGPSSIPTPPGRHVAPSRNSELGTRNSQLATRNSQPPLPPGWRLPYLSEEALRKYARVDPRSTTLKDRGLTLDMQEFKYLSYLAKVKARIEYVWKYPTTALQRGLRGSLYIRFTIGKDGSVKETVLLQPSGYRMLDQAALKAIQDAGPFLPLPESWGEDRITITGNFVYTMDYLYIR